MSLRTRLKAKRCILPQKFTTKCRPWTFIWICISKQCKGTKKKRYLSWKNMHTAKTKAERKPAPLYKWNLFFIFSWCFFRCYNICLLFRIKKNKEIVLFACSVEGIFFWILNLFHCIFNVSTLQSSNTTTR